jgi:hypothetical protein
VNLPWFQLGFAFAQGGAIFLTAWLRSRILKSNSWPAKLGCMTLSFGAWVSFTLFAFFWGANSYIVFFELTVSAFWSSVAFLAAWLVIPTMKLKKRD